MQCLAQPTGTMTDNKYSYIYQSSICVLRDLSRRNMHTEAEDCLKIAVAEGVKFCQEAKKSGFDGFDFPDHIA